MKRLLCLLLAILFAACAAPTAVQTTESDLPEPTPAQNEAAAAKPDTPAALPQPKTASDSAVWIWDDAEENNEWVCFQKTVELTAAPQSATVQIAATDHYWLWVNGTLAVFEGGLKRGPNRTDGWYDEVDLAPYLHKGTNVLAAKVWYWGRRAENITASHTYAEQAGFRMDGMIDKAPLFTNGTWMVYREKAYVNDTKTNKNPADRIAEYNVAFRAGDAIGDAWLTEPVTGTPWHSAKECSGDYGTLWPRPIPLYTFGAYRDFVNGADVIGHRTERKEDLVLRLPANIQFTVYLKVETSREREITLTTETSVQGKTFAKLITSGSGVDEWESLAWTNGDMLTLSAPGGVTILDVKYRPSGYACEAVGSFSMGDDLFDALYTAGVTTQQVCMRDTFMDCPDRERTQWWGDVTNQMEQSLYCLDPAAGLLYEKGLIQQLGYFRDNRFATTAPSEEDLELPIQQLAGIVGTYQYYLYTGRTEAVETVIDAYLSYLTNWAQDETGLVNILPTRGWSAETWYDAYTGEDAKALENAWYYWALKSCHGMATATGRDTAWLDDRMSAIKAAFDTTFWTGEGYRSAGREIYDDRANAVAVLSGLASAEKYPAIRQVLTEVLQCGTYMETYVLQALCEMGYVPDALERMHTRYAPMLSGMREHGDTTLWEYWSRDMGTKNHAWSAAPVLVLPKFVGGIRPTAPGYTAYTIAPDFSHTDHVSVSVETVLGTIAADATADGAMTLTLPEGGTASVRITNAASKAVFVNGIETAGTADGGDLWITVTESGTVKIAVQQPAF